MVIGQIVLLLLPMDWASSAWSLVRLYFCYCLWTGPVQHGHRSDCTFVVACGLNQFSMVIDQIVLLLLTESVQYGHRSDCTSVVVCVLSQFSMVIGQIVLQLLPVD